jgi:hypothetical protein
VWWNVRGRDDGSLELRRLRAYLQPRVRLRRWVVRLPWWPDKLRQHLRVACERSGALRRLLEGLRDEPSVRAWVVLHELSIADGQLRRRVHGCPERSAQLRRLRYPVYGWRDVRERTVRLLAAHHPVQRSVRQRLERPAQLRWLRHRLQQRTVRQQQL